MQNHQNIESASTNHGGLFAKVSMLFAGTMFISAMGTLAGLSISSTAAIITLAIVFLVLGIALPFIVKATSPTTALAIVSIWTFISGLFLGPAINIYVAELGWQTVFGAYFGTGTVMGVCGFIGLKSGYDFSHWGRWLFWSLLAMIVLALVNIFVGFGHFGTLLYSACGMFLFGGMFIFDFWRMSQEEDTWQNALNMTIQLYLNFVNFLLYALRFILEAKKN